MTPAADLVALAPRSRRARPNDPRSDDLAALADVIEELSHVLADARRLLQRVMSTPCPDCKRRRAAKAATMRRWRSGMSQ
jgi:hypothetical protein